MWDGASNYVLDRLGRLKVVKTFLTSTLPCVYRDIALLNSLHKLLHIKIRNTSVSFVAFFFNSENHILSVLVRPLPMGSNKLNIG